MPIESKNNIRNKILERVDNTAAFSKENAKKKELQQIRYPICVVKKNLLMLLDKKRKKKWLYTTMMNEISRERYRKEPTNNEED